MSTMMIDGVEVKAENLPDFTEDEARAYVDYARGNVAGKLRTLAVAPGKEPDIVTLSYAADNVRFERIRPFDDGNGRIGRLLMFKECLRHGVTPFILDDKRRSAYLEGLRLWDLDRSVLAAPCLEAQKRFENVIDTQRLLEEHHSQLLRDGFFRDKKRFDAEKEGK